MRRVADPAILFTLSLAAQFPIGNATPVGGFGPSLFFDSI